MVLAHDIYEGQRTRDVHISRDVTFDTMLLTSYTLQGLKNSGFYKPSPIQLHGIPLGKCGFDLLLEAKSGTGKTAVFSVIALEKLDLSKGLQVIILAPTREIAMQICDVLKQIGSSYKGLRVEVVMGGLPLKEDIEKFKNNVHIVVGSPGRLKHLIQDKHINSTAVRLFILDEADKLMEKSFQSDINYIHLALPRQKQVIMSSATYPEISKSFIKKYVQNAQHVCPDSSSILLGIEQKITLVEYNSNIVRQTQYKFTELLKILSNRQFKQCLIFCNYQARVSEIYKMLTKEKWPAEQLYGQQEQTERLDALKTLQEYKCRLLISTDLAARGIDASNVDLVVNFEPPFEWQTYLHRIGRAGRFGSYGTAVTILSEGKEQKKFKELLESIKLPFHLTDLWTNVEFCANENVIPNHNLSDLLTFENQCLDKEMTSSFNVKENYETLWNALTGDNKMINHIESFDNLYKSFTEPETADKIELFSDLLQSFGTSQHRTNEEDEFPKIYLVKLPLKDNVNITKSLNLTKNITSCPGDKSINYQEKCQNGKIKSKGNNENLAGTTTGVTKVDYKIHDHYSENEPQMVQSSRHYSAIDSKMIVGNNNGDLYGIDINNKKPEMHATNNLEIQSENLCRFGLPTSFSSSKNCMKSHNEFNKCLKYRKNTNSSILHCKNTVKINDQTNHHGNNNNDQINEVEQKIKDTFKRSEKIQKCTDPLSLNKTFEYNHRYEFGYEHRQSTSKCINRENVAKDQHNYSHLPKSLNQKPKNCREYFYNQKYIDWYNRLKLNVKQVEVTVYLNEIRKL